MSVQVFIAALVGIMVGAGITLLLTGGMAAQNLTRDEEQRCVQHILKNDNIGHKQDLIDELQRYASDLKIDIMHLSPQLEKIVRTVTDNWM